MQRMLADAGAAPLSKVQLETRVDEPHGTFADAADYAAQWVIFAVVFVLLAAIVTRICVKRFVEGSDAGTGLRFWSYIGAAIAGLGGFGHAIFTAIDAGEHWLPTFDAVTIIWIGVAIVALVLPDFSEFTVAGVSVKRADIANLSMSAVNDTAELLRDWALSLNTLLATFDDEAVTPEQGAGEISQFLQLRSYEALEWLAGDNEERRLSVWLYDQATDDLFFFFSNEIKDPETLEYRFPFGKGIIGTVYRDHRIVNARNATTLPVYERIRPTATQYRGILCIPIDYGETRYGVLSIDRQKEQQFEAAEVDVMSALAAVFGTALGSQNARQLLSSVD